MKIIYKVEVSECPHLTFRLGENGVQFIKETSIQISSCAETQSSSNKLVYEVHFFDGHTIEISADLKGLVVYKIDKSKLKEIKNERP